jgi:putative acetyltransferase
MARKIRDLETWVAEVNGSVVGWGAIRGDRLEGLYTHPKYIGQGVGSGLLELLEGLMRKRDVGILHTEASSNAEAFYVRRGYEPIGGRTGEGAQRKKKVLQ